MSEEKILPSCIPLPLEKEQLEEIVSKAKDYALMHGICMRSKNNYNPDSLQVNSITNRRNSRPHTSSLQYKENNETQNDYRKVISVNSALCLHR
jgi:glutathione synthase